ncbi:hypothetical protein ABZ820_12445 [Streptomyces diacarni]|uniref:hypothetical protein n=1 Tax=Streptomyces diacarni TaxID=2800381 RepID=UPI0033F6F16D
MLNAAEVSMDQAAEDDAERARNRAKLYAPPGRIRRGRGGRLTGPPGSGMGRAQAQALAAQVAAEDARLAKGRTG